LQVLGQTLLAAGLYKVHGATLVALKRGKQFINLPSPHLAVEEGDILYYAGELDPLISTGEEFGLQLVTAETERSDTWREAQNGLNIEVKKIIQVRIDSIATVCLTEVV
jgi:uncharacterized protein with PhoU and TrkA domain